MTEKDIWTAAGLLIQEHGEHAAIIAAQKADAFLESGNLDAQRIWMRVTKAAASLIDVPEGAAN
jgi:hypothetical protein